MSEEKRRASAGRLASAFALSEWSLRRKLALVLAIPMLLAAVFGGLRVHTELVSADNYSATAKQITEGYRRLYARRMLVPTGDFVSIRMAPPFAGVPTQHRVTVNNTAYFANCAWDAFGICAALHTDGDIETVCADCGEPIAVGVQAGRPDDDRLLFHCLAPAAGWWDDIVFT